MAFWPAGLSLREPQVLRGIKGEPGERLLHRAPCTEINDPRVVLPLRPSNGQWIKRFRRGGGDDFLSPLNRRSSRPWFDGAIEGDIAPPTDGGGSHHLSKLPVRKIAVRQHGSDRPKRITRGDRPFRIPARLHVLVDDVGNGSFLEMDMRHENSLYLPRSGAPVDSSIAPCSFDDCREVLNFQTGYAEQRERMTASLTCQLPSFVVANNSGKEGLTVALRRRDGGNR